jgi:hypothetical protein
MRYTSSSTARPFLLACACALLVAPLSLRADDVTDTIDEALKAYKDKDYVTAAQSLEAAAQLIKQKRAEGLTQFLPQPPSGWTAEDASSQAMAASFFGGGVTAERVYSKGDAQITIKILTDSPLMQGVMMMMSNPMFAGADGGKLVRIKGQRAIQKFNAEDENGSINVVVAGAILVQIEGSDCTEADLTTLANAIDYAGLAGTL